MTEHPTRVPDPAPDSTFSDLDSFEARMQALKGKYDGLFTDSSAASDTASGRTSPQPTPRPTPSTAPRPTGSAPRPRSTFPTLDETTFSDASALPPATTARPRSFRPLTGDSSRTTSTPSGTGAPAGITPRPPVTSRPRPSLFPPVPVEPPVAIPPDLLDEDVDVTPPPVVVPAEPRAGVREIAVPEPDLPHLRARLESEPAAEPPALDWLAPEETTEPEPPAPSRVRTTRPTPRPAVSATQATLSARQRPAPEEPRAPEVPVKPAPTPRVTVKPLVTPSQPTPEFVAPDAPVPTTDDAAQTTSVIVPVAKPAPKPTAKAPAKPTPEPPAKPAKPAKVSAPAAAPQSRPTGTVLQARGVALAYTRGTTTVNALRGVALTVTAGDMVGLVGPSGAGKSALLRCLAGLEQPTGGTIMVANTDLAAATDNQRSKLRRTAVAALFESDNLIGTLTVAENIRLPLAIGRRAVSEEWVDQVVRLFGLADLLNRRPADLTPAEEQRVACARAVVARPHVILADEPTRYLTTADAASLLALLKRVATELGQAVVIATRDPAVASTATRVILLVDGAVVSELGNATEGAIRDTLARNTEGA